ncbi:MAG: DUF975 family protein [Oscillospiraceae bacterium]|nr:DUF975 family protein [Oscillospiraceae bacterium]MBQ7130491.1 DUF975 family protein [Oscillospiraceae bacterium]
MNVRNIRELKDFAARRLDACREDKRIVLIYAALALGSSALVTVANYVIGSQIDNFGGLSNMGTRALLSALQSMLPIVQNLFSMCLEVGFLAAMLRIARGQYVSPNTLRLGFDRFWVLLRCSLFMGLMMSAVVFVSIYLGVMVFMMTPFSEPAMEVLMPFISDATVLSSDIVLTDGAAEQLSQAITPAFVFCGIFLCLLGIPVLYNYRMVNYVIIDKPALGAMAALSASKRMMRGNRIALFKLDVSLWWYYLAMTLATVAGYGDTILPMLGITLPGPEMLWYFVFYAVYLLLILGIYYLLRSRLEVTYALAYDAVKPKETQNDGVILGSIFQM